MDIAQEAEAITLDPWIIYQLACKATLHRQPRFAAELFEQLAQLVSQIPPLSLLFCFRL